MKPDKSWERGFDEKFNHDSPGGVAVVLIDEHGQRPAQHELKRFIQRMREEAFEDGMKYADEMRKTVKKVNKKLKKRMK